MDTNLVVEREIVRRNLDVFLLIDTSREISIDEVEQIRTQLKNDLVQEQLRQRDWNIRISEAVFSEKVRWIAESIPILEYVPEALTISGGADYVALFRSLNKRMSRNDLIAHEGRRAIPYVFFITDGKTAGELQDRITALEELKKNGWFHCAFRYAVLIGDSYNDPEAREAVKDFVNSPDEGILGGRDLESQLNIFIKRSCGGDLDIREPILHPNSYENGSFIESSQLPPFPLNINFD